MQPSISIVTVAYNSATTIRTTIESVLEQSYHPYEYWIIDGKSQDATLEIAESYRQAFVNQGIVFQIISEPDRGIYDAMNKGIQHCSGDLVGMINSDDWYEKNALERVAQFYEKTQFDMMYADLNILKSTGNVVKHSRLRRYITSRDWNHPTTFITKELYAQYQYKVKNLYDDFDLAIRIRLHGHKVEILNEVLANFRYGGVSNEKDLKKAIQRVRARYEVYRSNGLSRWYWFECVGMELAKLMMG